MESQYFNNKLYLSIFEWWHPLWVNEETRERYVDEVLHPQFKEVIIRYKPWFVFMDGDWEGDSSTFKSTDMVEWLLNESPVREKVVFNDRWGHSRKLNGMVYNSEFGGGDGYRRTKDVKYERRLWDMFHAVKNFNNKIHKGDYYRNNDSNCLL